MFVYFVNQSLVLNLIYSKQLVLLYNIILFMTCRLYKLSRLTHRVTSYEPH